LELYQYRKLAKNRNIRLLKLRTRWFFNEPSCELIEVPLDQTPPFEAVSYTWGEKAPAIPIELDGKEILVTANVDEFLSHQRSIFGPKCFWIDAICINQKDNNEKNDQLPLMTDIYKSASRVIVWLGPPESSQGTRVVRKMIMALNWPQPQVVMKHRGMKTRDLLPNFFRDEKEAFVTISKFLSHSWFERIWVVQEIACGKKGNVMYHGTCLDWDDLVAAAHRLYTDLSLKLDWFSLASPEIDSSDVADPSLGRSATINTTHGIKFGNIKTLEMVRVSVQKEDVASLASLLQSHKPKRLRIRSPRYIQKWPPTAFSTFTLQVRL
jgi:hypothetical protein